MRRIRDHLIPRLFYSNTTIENYFRRQGCRIGTGNSIAIKTLGPEPFLIQIGDRCTITAGVKFLTHDGATRIFRTEHPDLRVFGKIEVRDNSFIGTCALILPNVTIGPSSVVGAGSVVTEDVPPHTVVAGVPATPICSLEEYRANCLEQSRRIDLRGHGEERRRRLIRHFWEEENRSG